MQWQERLYHYSEEPPEEVWANLKKDLENEPYHLRNSLSEIEETPPADAWDNIKSRLTLLQETNEEKPVHPVRIKRIFAYAASLAATVLLITALVNLMRSERDIDSSIFSTSITQRDSQQRANETSKSTQPVNGQPEVIYSDRNYILISDREGGYNRVSRKFMEMYQVMYSQDQKKIQDKQYWNNTLNQWRMKMEQSTFMPAATNFFDLAEMVSVLEENK